MEASALKRASKRGLLARRSPLLRMESDPRLVALIRAGHEGAFEILFNRYHSRLLGFCQSMLKSRQDAEDVLQEVFANAHSAMLGDEREINVRPWLYRIARNRCLNHLRKPVPDGQDSMDILPSEHGTSTAERVQNREELRLLMADVKTLPETQRTALLLREIDQMSYEEIAQAMQTTVPSVKSLLVRARIGLAESSQARLLTCGEVQLKLAEAAEGLAKTTGPVRKHVRACDECRGFRDQLRADHKALASIVPVGIFGLLHGGLLAKLFGGGAAGSTGGAAGAGAIGTAGSAAGAAAGTAGAVGGIAGAVGGAIGTKAAAGVATAALLTAGAVEVQNSGTPVEPTTAAQAPISAPAPPATDPAGDPKTTPPAKQITMLAKPTPAKPAAREQRSEEVPVEPTPPVEAPLPVIEDEVTEPEPVEPETPVEPPPVDEGEVAIGAPPVDEDDSMGEEIPSEEPAEIPTTDPSLPPVAESPTEQPPIESTPTVPPEPVPTPTVPPEATPEPEPTDPTDPVDSSGVATPAPAPPTPRR